MSRGDDFNWVIWMLTVGWTTLEHDLQTSHTHEPEKSGVGMSAWRANVTSANMYIAHIVTNSEFEILCPSRRLQPVNSCRPSYSDRKYVWWQLRPNRYSTWCTGRTGFVKKAQCSQSLAWMYWINRGLSYLRLLDQSFCFCWHIGQIPWISFMFIATQKYW